MDEWFCGWWDRFETYLWPWAEDPVSRLICALRLVLTAEPVLQGIVSNGCINTDDVSEWEDKPGADGMAFLTDEINNYFNTTLCVPTQNTEKVYKDRNGHLDVLGT